MKKIYSIVLCLGLLIGFVACDGDKEFVKTECVITSEQIDVSQQSATITSIITTEATAIEVNLQYAITSNFADYQSVKMKQSGEKYVAQLVNLQENTTYYIRYVASNAYSSMIVDEKHSFTTTQTSTHEYVDLGLSVKWATCNIGANSPEEYGDYFAWGETVTKKNYYGEENYKWGNYVYNDGSGNMKYTKYCTDSTYGYVDNKVVLDKEDDAAYVHWGGDWRMPTIKELNELIERCTWKTLYKNGVFGYQVTGSNGNSIFLPAGGRMIDGESYDEEDKEIGVAGWYWTSTLNASYCGYILWFDKDIWFDECGGRESGLSIRPVYGSRVEETTLPTVVTNTVTQITETSAVAGGNVMSDGNASVTERGVVYSKNPNPVITNLNNTIRPCGSGTGVFTYNMTGLQSGTIYYVRAYAKNDVGTAYGEEVSFTTKEEMVDNPPSNLVAMPFSVSAGKQVTFSQGNLQYTQSTNTWSFAENQYDYIGTDNVTGGSVSSDPIYGYSKSGTALADKIDLFGWSTSATYFGVSTSNSNSDYSGSFVDWGSNQIGSDAPNTWRTLTYDEWKYLLNTRPNASSLKGVAQVNGVNGLILLPDNWTCPAGVTFKSGFHSKWGADYYAAYQTFTVAEWSLLEAAGAVFLPAAGCRDGSYVGLVQCIGEYWSATEYDSDGADYLKFYSDKAHIVGSHYRYSGLSVRLVKDL